MRAGGDATATHEGSTLTRLVRQGPYSTDGVRLFRLAGVVWGSSGLKLVRLEDCSTLDVAGYTSEEVTLLGLEPVTAEGAPGDAGLHPGRELVTAGADNAR